MRTQNSVKNMMAAFLGQGVSIILTFISRRIFLMFLTVEYLGINGLFTNVLSMLSLAELGLGTAIIYSLYKPVAENDTKKINQLMGFYKKAYMVIAIIILFIGLSIFPFLDVIIKNKPDIPNINMYFLIFLADIVITYFYSYKRSIIIANQKQYIVTKYKYLFFTFMNIAQIILLAITRNYILYLLTKTLFVIIENISISKKADKMYPNVTYDKNNKLDEQTKSDLFKNVKALIVHRIGGIIVNATDNIIISIFIGVYSVGIYSNYNLVISALTSIIVQIFLSFTASIGNLTVSESKDKSYNVFKSILFANFWIIGFFIITLFMILNDFIQLWLGAEYLMEISVVVPIIINFYLYGIRRTTLAFRDAMGLFYEDRFKPLAECLVNLIVSIILVKIYGIVGVFIGTIISTITTCFWIEPYILYKYGFKKKVIEYFILFFKYTTVIIILGIITWWICSIITTIAWISLIIKLIICIIVPNMIFLLLFYKTKEFKYLLAVGKNIILTRRNNTNGNKTK